MEEKDNLFYKINEISKEVEKTLNNYINEYKINNKSICLLTDALFLV